MLDAPWPEADPALLVEDSVLMPIQVNGKKRGELTIARGSDQDSVKTAALADQGVARTLEGLTIRKVIVVPDRIVNIVAS